MSWVKIRPAGVAAALVVMILALVGCAPTPLERLHAYDGPQRSLKQVATVFGGRYERNFNNPQRSVELSPYVNGRPTGEFASVLYLQPGTHSLRVVYRADGASAGGTLTARFQAGHAYEVKFEIEKEDEKDRGLLASLTGQPPKRTIRFWLEDRGRRFVVTDDVLVHEQ